MTLKILTIKKSVEFKNIKNYCKKFHSNSLILTESKTSEKHLFDNKSGKNLQDFCRVGTTVSKVVSKSSCERNLIKRRIREATKSIASEIAKNHHDYVIIAKKQILEVDYKKIYNDLKFCFKRI
jgi:ribonuclease P protein component